MGQDSAHYKEDDQIVYGKQRTDRYYQGTLCSNGIAKIRVGRVGHVSSRYEYSHSVDAEPHAANQLKGPLNVQICESHLIPIDVIDSDFDQKVETLPASVVHH